MEQKVNVRGAYSNWVKRISGVPWGHLPEGLKSYLNTFVDDATVMREIRSVQDCKNVERET